MTFSWELCRITGLSWFEEAAADSLSHSEAFSWWSDNATDWQVNQIRMENKTFGPAVVIISSITLILIHQQTLFSNRNLQLSGTAITWGQLSAAAFTLRASPRIFRVCFGAHTWALLRHSSKQQPSAAAALPVQHLTGRSLHLHMDYLFRLPPLLHIHCSALYRWPHGVHNNPQKKISSHGLMHSHFQSCLCNIRPFSPSAPSSGGMFGHK